MCRQQIIGVLEGIAKKESITLEKWFAARIANNSNGNLRRAILMLEACKVQKWVPLLLLRALAVVLFRHVGASLCFCLSATRSRKPSRCNCPTGSFSRTPLPATFFENKAHPRCWGCARNCTGCW